MKLTWVLFLLSFSTSLMAQSPVIETLAYSRKTIPGAPGNNQTALSSRNQFPTSYFIYLVVKKGTVLSVAGVFVQGKWYNAPWKKIDSPVVMERDVSVPTGRKDTLVKKTSDDVYQVEIDSPKALNEKDPAADQLAHQNEVVVCIKSGKSSWYGVVKAIVPLHPAAAM